MVNTLGLRILSKRFFRGLSFWFCSILCAEEYIPRFQFCFQTHGGNWSPNAEIWLRICITSSSHFFRKSGLFQRIVLWSCPSILPSSKNIFTFWRTIKKFLSFMFINISYISFPGYFIFYLIHIFKHSSYCAENQKIPLLSFFFLKVSNI